MLNLVHTTETLMQGKNAPRNLPRGAGEDFVYEDTDSDEGGDAGPHTVVICQNSSYPMSLYLGMLAENLWCNTTWL